MPKIKCSCGYTWQYTGKAKRACCPQCGNKNTVKTHRTDRHKQKPSRGPVMRDDHVTHLEAMLEGMHNIVSQKIDTITHLNSVIDDLAFELSFAKSNGQPAEDTLEAKLYEEMMKAPVGTDEHVNRQLEVAQNIIKKLRESRKV